MAPLHYQKTGFFWYFFFGGGISLAQDFLGTRELVVFIRKKSWNNTRIFARPEHKKNGLNKDLNNLW